MGRPGRGLSGLAAGHTRYPADRLVEAGIAIVTPPRGHAVYLDALCFLPHMPGDQFPGQGLLVGLYLEGGIRAVEIGSVIFARKDERTGETVYPEMELVRLAIPRRVYTQSHLDCVADTLIALSHRREALCGLRIVYETRFLRHFAARFELV